MDERKGVGRSTVLFTCMETERASCALHDANCPHPTNGVHSSFGGPSSVGIVESESFAIGIWNFVLFFKSKIQTCTTSNISQKPKHQLNSSQDPLEYPDRCKVSKSHCTIFTHKASPCLQTSAVLPKSN